jgi:hypothetical protein
MDEGASDVRVPLLVGLSGAASALVSLPLAAAAGEPYLSFSDVNAWMVVFAAGLFTILFAGPFVIEVRLRDRVPDRDNRWEQALLIWGAVCAGVLLAGLLIGGTGGFSGDSLAGSAGLLIGIAAGLVEATLVVWLLSGG